MDFFFFNIYFYIRLYSNNWKKNKYRFTNICLGKCLVIFFLVFSDWDRPCRGRCRNKTKCWFSKVLRFGDRWDTWRLPRQCRVGGEVKFVGGKDLSSKFLRDSALKFVEKNKKSARSSRSARCNFCLNVTLLCFKMPFLCFSLERLI